jgi:hypothetical protein
MKGYSTFFTFEELTDSNSFPELLENNRKHAMQFINAGKRLSKLLESVRYILGDKPLKVTSGFRNQLLNIAVGSKAKNSAHQRFEAADILPNGVSLQEAFTAILMAQRGGLLPDLRKAIREDHKGIIHVEVKMKADEPTEFYTTNDNVKFKRV